MKKYHLSDGSINLRLLRHDLNACIYAIQTVTQMTGLNRGESSERDELMRISIGRLIEIQNELAGIDHAKLSPDHS